MTALSMPSSLKSGIDNAADPSRDIRAGLVIAVVFFVIVLGWAALTRLDAAAYAQGTLVVSGQRQSVQHRDGGVVGRIHVREGQRVVRGQLLMELTAAEVHAQERALASQAIRLLAQRARLEAEQLGQARFAPPAEFAALDSEDRNEASLAMRLQQTELGARSAVLSTQRGILAQRVAQAGAQARGFDEQAKSTAEQLHLINQQILMLQPLVEKGFVSQTRMRELDRARAALKGQRGQFSESVTQTQSAAREYEIEAVEAGQTFRERTAADLRDIETRLGEVLPKWSAAQDQLERTVIRAPATGAIVGLSVFTPGGVVGAGQKLMDIVPEHTPLRVQVRIAPDDADDLLIGLAALVKFPGLHERNLPDLEGRLTQLSADSFTDERTGQSYFTGEITVAPNQIALIRNVRGRDFALRPGMPVEVLIPLHSRTALDYALEPLIGSFWSSFREH